MANICTRGPQSLSSLRRQTIPREQGKIRSSI